MTQSRLDIATRTRESSVPTLTVSVKVEQKGRPNLAGINYCMLCFLSGSPKAHYSKKDIQTWGVRKGDLVSLSTEFSNLLPRRSNEVLTNLPVLPRSSFPYSLSGIEGCLDLQEDEDRWGDLEYSRLSITSEEGLYLSSNQIPTRQSR